MESPLGFVLREARESIFDFFIDWFYIYPKKIVRSLINFFKDFDRSLGLEAMVRNWFNPLYQDYTIWGYIIGITIRTIYIFVAGVLFFITYLIFSIFVIILWYLIPILIFILILKNIIFGF